MGETQVVADFQIWSKNRKAIAWWKKKGNMWVAGDFQIWS